MDLNFAAAPHREVAALIKFLADAPLPLLPLREAENKFLLAEIKLENEVTTFIK